MGETVTSWAKLRQALPQGLELPLATWAARHRVIVAVLAAHAVALPIFGLWRGWSPAYAVGEGALLALLAVLASRPTLSRRFRSSVASLGCVTSSAVLTQFSGGLIEAHFHFFIIVALVSMYQDWVPFLLAILYVAVDHGIVGTLMPSWVYNHPDAIAHPWKWAAIHAVAVLAECSALLAYWTHAEESRLQNQLVLDSAGDGILGLDSSGRVTFANPAAARLMGRASDSLLGMQADAWHPAWRSDNTAALTGEFTLAGTPVEWLLAPTLRGTGGTAQVLTLKDATSRAQAEAERRKSEVLAEQDRFKTQLLNTASHELNTPLGILRLQLRVLSKDLDQATPAIREGFMRVQRNVERLSGLVKDTLDVARLEGGKLPLVKSQTDLAKLARETCDSFSEAVRQKGIQLTYVGAQSVPMEGDANRLVQVVVNLVGNALKFTPPQGQVSVHVEAKDGMACLEVRDSGPGIPQADLDKLFKPFSQLVDSQGGTGLGLYISKGIVEQHGGRLWCEPGPPSGAVFRLAIPITTPSVTLTPMIQNDALGPKTRPEVRMSRPSWV